MTDCTLAYTSFAAGTKLQMNTSNTPNPNFYEKYQQIISMLMYPMLGSCPDICFTVNQLAQYGTNPTQRHIITALHVFWYLVEDRIPRMIGFQIQVLQNLASTYVLHWPCSLSLYLGKSQGSESSDLVMSRKHNLS